MAQATRTVLTGLNETRARQALIAGRPTEPLFAAVLDLQAFGLFNQAFGSRLANLVIDLVTTSLKRAIVRLSRPFWSLSFGDEHYFFTRAAAAEVDDLVEVFETAIAKAALMLDNQFAPIHIGWAGPRADGLVHLPSSVHDFLHCHQILSAAVASGGRFDALAFLANDRNVHDHVRTIQSAYDGLLVVTAHDLYDDTRRPGRWRLPFPQFRLASGIVTGTPDSLTANEAVDFILQELHRAMEQARSDGLLSIRRDMAIARPAFSDGTPPGPSIGATDLASIRTFEKSIARQRGTLESWQLLLLKPRWTLPAFPAGRRTLNSLKALTSATNPGFVDRLLGAEHAAFASLASKQGYAFGASGNSLMLAIAGRMLTQGETRQLLDQFLTACELPGGAEVSHLEALTVEGHGKATLLRAFAAAQSHLPMIAQPTKHDPINLVSLRESDLPLIERLIDDRRARALETYEDLHRGGSARPSTSNFGYASQ